MALPKLNNARYTTVIPSTGQEVEFRPYLVKEEKILMLALESNDQKQILKAVVDVIKSCIYDDIDENNLAMVDIESLFIALRSKSSGEKIDLQVKCNECDTANNVTIDFEEINVPEFDEKDGTIMLTDEVGLTLRVPSYKDVIKSQSSGKSNDVELAFNMMIDSIETIFDADGVYKASDEKRSTLVEFVDSLNNEQFTKVGDFFTDMPQLQYDIEFDCVKCKAENKHEIRGLQGFFT